MDKLLVCDKPPPFTLKVLYGKQNYTPSPPPHHKMANLETTLAIVDYLIFFVITVDVNYFLGRFPKPAGHAIYAVNELLSINCWFSFLFICRIQCLVEKTETESKLQE